MSAYEQLGYLSIAGLAIAFAAGLIPQFLVTSREKGLRKFLTPAGVVALAITTLGLMTAITSGLLTISVKNEEQREKDRLGREATLREGDRIAAEKAAIAEEAMWRARSDALAKRILDNTDRQLSAAETAFAATIEGFRQEQLRQQRTFAELQQSTRRILLPVGRLTYGASIDYRCDSAPYPAPCEYRGRIHEGVRTASSPADLRDPEGQEIAVTLYFALPKSDARIHVSGSLLAGETLIYGRLQARLSDRSPPDLFLHNRADSVGLSFVRSRPAISPAISQELSSMLDLQGRTILIWGKALADADTLSFTITNPDDVQLLSKCTKAQAINSGFRFIDDSYRIAFVCTFGKVF
jgi:hypothetical protein